MGKTSRTGLVFFLGTTAAWTFAAVIGLWILDSSFVQSLPNGFIAIAVVGVVVILMVSLVQWMLLEKANFFLWMAATSVGFGTGLLGIILANFIARMPVLSFSSGVAIIDFFVWVGFLFLLSALASIPGGLIAGLLGKWSVGKGTVRSWLAVSIGNWAVSFGGVGVFLGLSDFSIYFYSGNFRYLPTLLRGAAFGIIIGLIQGAIVGTFLRKISHREILSNNARNGQVRTHWLPVLLILVVLGLLAGYGITELKPAEQEVSWKLLGTPPSPAVSFVRVSPLVVSTRNGEMYRFVSTAYGWEMLEEKPSKPPEQSFPDLCEGITPAPLKDTVDSVEFCAKHEVGTSYRQYAILEDGSVWMWKKDD